MKHHTKGEVRYVNGKRVATPEYRAWQAMKARCLNPQSRDYGYYGGRGITVYPAWLDFNVFLSDVGRRPTPAHTLDRIDGDGGYEPGNVRWATRQVQARNRAYARTKSWELAQQLGVKMMTAHHYIWRVRAMDAGRPADGISPDLADTVRAFLRKNNA
jgi:hypothetical protein